jgi:hypothetical protein
MNEQREKEKEEKFLSSSSYKHTVFSNAARMGSSSDLTVQQTTRKLCTRER